MRSKYAAYTLAALSLGLGLGFWHLANENSRLGRLVRVSQAEVLEARAQIEALNEKVRAETKERRTAEAARTIAENSERMSREKLSHETRARETAERAAAAAAATLAAARAAQAEAEQALVTANAKLAQEIDARKSLEGELLSAQEQVRTASARLLLEIAARQQIQAANPSADHEVAAEGEAPGACEPKETSKPAPGVPAADATVGSGGESSAEGQQQARMSHVKAGWAPVLAVQ